MRAIELHRNHDPIAATGLTSLSQDLRGRTSNKEFKPLVSLTEDAFHAVFSSVIYVSPLKASILTKLTLSTLKFNLSLFNLSLKSFCVVLRH